MKRVMLHILSFSLLIPALLFGQEFAKVGTAGAQFLKIGIGGRGVGMSDAYSSVCNDASAIFWNPAGLTHIDNMSVIFAHANWLAGLKYEAAAVVKNFGMGGLVGVSFAYLTSGEIEETTVEQQEGTGRMFDTGDLVVGLSYAKQLSDKFSIGGNAKYIEERLDTEKAWAWAIDIGSLYYTGFNSLRMGMYIRNFGPELKMGGTYTDYDNGSVILDPETLTPQENDYLAYHMPMTFAVGVAYDFFQNNDMYQLTTAVDLLHPNDNVEKLNLGAELVIFNMLSIRGGYVSPFGVLGKEDTEIENRDDAENEYSLKVNNYSQSFSAGLGFNLNIPGMGKAALDYAYTDFGVLDWVHRASLVINF
ncbi:PorV/PorQ family protein [candidate division KSB1 bacterium]|nr:PorV/PorQ family protein [candidate division KSB1 bacterium]